MLILMVFCSDLVLIPLTSPRSVAARVNPHLLLFRSGFNNVATVLQTVSDMFFVDLVAEQQVSSLCLEAHEFMIAGRWLDLALLTITSADLVFSKASNKEKTKASGEKVRNDMELMLITVLLKEFTSKFKRYLTKDLPDIVMQVSVMKRLRHPNIVLFMGAVISPHHVCIVTEFLCRGSLFHLLHRRRVGFNLKHHVRMALDIVSNLPMRKARRCCRKVILFC
ncbi:putative protein kinase TKL-CTR1-DRK-2 family [Helianthus debilis subsp. tardiflorus]